MLARDGHARSRGRVIGRNEQGEQKLVVRNKVALTLDRAAILAKAREYGLSVAKSLK